MNGLATISLTGTSTTHHGPARHDRHSRAMDIDIGASRGRAPSSHPSLTNPPMNTAISTEQSAPPSSVQPSNPDPSSSVPAITLSSSAQADGLKFDAPLQLCRTAYAPSKPHPSQDLLSLYGLSPLVATVARVDPVTGEKINKLRRSYEGQVKTFGLAGRNKAIKHEEDTPGGLVEMSAWPDEEWYVQKVSGKELSKGLSSGTLSKLEKALKLEPGPVPKNDEWENILGHESRKGPVLEGKAKQPVPSTVKAPKANGQTNGVTTVPAEKGVARPQRARKRTRYDDASFEGYGEGFVDDDRDDEDGYTSNDGSKRSSGSRKKRRKSGTYNKVTTTTSISDRVSYTGGMIQQQHVGRGIGAYGGR